MHSRLIAYAILFFLSGQVFGQSITVEVSDNEVEVGERFTITYSFTGGDEVEVPSFRNFEIIYSGNSEGIQFSNGKFTRVGEYVFTLVAYQTGTFEIPPAVLHAKGRKLKSPPVVIKVTDNGQKTGQKGQQPMSSHHSPTGKESVKDLIFALAETDKKKVYVGQQITLTYHILSRVNFHSLEEYKAPQYKGFLTQNIKVDEDAPGFVRKYNGADYYNQEISKIALYGTYPGQFTIEPMHFRAVALIPEQYPFMGGQPIEVPKNVVLPTNKISLEVMPLPEEGKPKDFSGLVGVWDADRNLSSYKVQVGKAIQLKYHVTGVGDLKSVVFPDFNYPEGVEAFEPQTQTAEKLYDGFQLGGTRTFEQSLVFKEPGTYIIPGFSFSYFDTRSEQYISKTLPEMRVEVISGKAGDTDVLSMNGETFISDIQSGWQEEEKLDTVHLLSYVGAAFPFMALTLVAVYRRVRRNKPMNQSDPELTLPDLKDMDSEQQYATVENYLMRALSQLAGTDQPEELQKWLSVQADRSAYIQFQYIVSSCHRARYSPLSSETADQLLQQAASLIQRLSSPSAVSA